MKAQNKPPAFPVHPDAHKLSDAECGALSSMSLRDCFAGKAIGTAWRDLVRDEDAEIGTTAGGLELMPGEDVYTSAPNIAAKAYEIADAMLAERAKSL
jgi:hypothetical protein